MTSQKAVRGGGCWSITHFARPSARPRSSVAIRSRTRSRASTNRLHRRPRGRPQGGVILSQRCALVLPAHPPESVRADLGRDREVVGPRGLLEHNVRRSRSRQRLARARRGAILARDSTLETLVIALVTAARRFHLPSQ